MAYLFIVIGIVLLLGLTVLVLNVIQKRMLANADGSNSRRGNELSKVKNVLLKIFEYTILTLVAAFLIFPFYLLFIRSFMTEHDNQLARIWPSVWTADNFKSIFQESNYLTYTLNTLKVVVINMLVVPIAASLCAYSFSRIKWKGSNFVFMCVLSTIMIPGTVLQIPLYVMFYDFGWIGSLKPLIIPAFFGGGAINIFLMKQFMLSIPKEMDEAAMIDGANVFQRYLMVLPLCSSILIYVMVGTFSSGWSDFMGPLVYVTDQKHYTLAVAIYQDTISGSTLGTTGLRMAAGLFMMSIPAIVFVLYQRKLVDGIMIGAVKG